MGARRAWVLNLDADLELAVTAWTPPAAVREAVARHAPVVAAALLEGGDLVVDDATPPGAARGLPGRAFSPTPRAIACLRRAGAEPEPHPPVEVLRRVSSRAFAAELGQTLEGAAFVRDAEAARGVLAEAPPIARAWRVKPAFGMSGRGQRVIAPGALGRADEAFVSAAVLRGGAQIEPNVAIAAELAIHGMIDEGGGLALGRLVAQRCDARGAWLSTEPAHDPEIEASLREEAARVAAALFAAGYFGPFGIDAFTYVGPRGAPILRARSEINARYTMGFGVGLNGRARAP